jgi:ketosteroid isomerase-like protein
MLDVPDCELSREQVIARNLAVVEAHFHNEHPDRIDEALRLYTDDIVWEGPSRGQVYLDAATVRRSYLDIFATIKVHKFVTLRRFATEQYVFDDQISDETIVGDPARMPNLPYPRGTRMSTRLTHLFEMRDGRIAREIAYEIWRRRGSPEDNDLIPAGATVVSFD